MILLGVSKLPRYGCIERQEDPTKSREKGPS